MTKELNPPTEKLAELVKNELKGYSAPELVRKDGTTWTFRTLWVPYKRRRFLKADLEEPESPTSRRALGKGYNTENASRIAAMIQHDGVLVPVHTFGPEITQKYGLYETVRIEDEILDDNGETSQNLEEILLSEKIKLKDSDLIGIAREYLSIIRDINLGIGVQEDTEILHGDIKPGNIVVRRVKGKPIVKVVDWSNSRLKNAEKPRTESTLGTGGSRQTLSPESRQGVYDERSEVFSAAATLGILLSRGKEVIEFDESGWRYGIDLKSDKWLPKHLRKFAQVIRKGLEIDPNQRYQTVSEMLRDFNKINDKPSRLRRLGLVGVVAGTLLAMGGLTGGLFYINRTKGDLEQKMSKMDYRSKVSQRQEIINSYLRSRDKLSIPKMDSSEYLSWLRLKIWLDKFAPFDYKNPEKNQRFGDEKTAFAAYLDSLNKEPDDGDFETPYEYEVPPVTVYEAIQRAKGSTDYKVIEPIIKEINPELYYDVEQITFKYIDNWALTAHKYEEERTNKLWEGAKKLYQEKQGRLRKEAEKQKKPGEINSPVLYEPYSGWKYIKK